MSKELSLNFLCINVCGLRSKLIYPEFKAYVNEFDVIACSETKLDDLDEIILENHQCITKNRKQKTLRKSGGIAFLIKNNFFKYFTFLESECEYVQWFKLSKIVCNTTEDILIGAVYVPPENSPYSRDCILEQFYFELDEHIRTFKNVILMGDFNARTSNLDDFSDIDKELYEHIDVDIDEIFSSDAIDEIIKYGHDIKRISKDNKTNKFGKNLIESCKYNEMFILNGRCFDDKGVGKTTCKNASVIDYVLSSAPLIKYISSFAVKDFCELFSDSHCPVEFSLKSVVDPILKPSLTNTTKTKPWNEAKKEEFNLNIDLQKLKAIFDRLDDESNKDKQNINFIMDEIELLFTESANTTLGTYTLRSSRTQTDDKWFNFDCRTARRKYHLARKSYSLNKNPENYEYLSNASKQYKRTIKKNISRYKNSFHNKIRGMRQTSPREYWKYVNSANKKHINPNVDIDMFYDFFKNINENEINDPNVPESDFPQFTEESYLNSEITVDEIAQAIRNVKNNKATGLDKIANEYIKSTSNLFLPVYHRLFNTVLDTAILPDAWLVGVIKPIFKNKGNIEDPNNYRPITILSCMGKVFTAVLNNRLQRFLETNNLLNENQCGFRKGYSTCDNIFVMYALIEYLKVRKMKLFCAFIDFQKAFDSVWRVGLWSKLLKYNINGKVLSVIKSMYSNIKSCVDFNDKQSGFFTCKNGLRQGENLSPILFSLFLNDVEHYLSKNMQVGLNIHDQYFNSYLRIIVLLYADDTVLFAESEEELKTLLNDFWKYCNDWKLTINPEKSKIMVFGERARTNHNITINDKIIEVVDTFKYLGVLFSKTRNFFKTKRHVVEQARKAMFCLFRKIRNLDLPIDCQIKLFDNTVLPILTYGCEIWGFGDISCIEKVHTDFLKRILHVKKSTPHVMIYGE